MSAGPGGQAQGPSLRPFRWVTLLFAFLLATASWAYVDARRIETKQFRVPIHISLPEGWDLRTPPPRRFLATLQGPGELINNLREDDLAVRKTIEPTGEVSDEDNIRVHIQDQEIPTPPGVLVVEKELDSFEVEIVRLLHQHIRVKPVVEGTPADGYRMVRAEPYPYHITVMAPKGSISHEDYLECYPVDIDGAVRDISRAVAVKPKRIEGRLVRNDTDVLVTVIIDPVPQERTFPAVPVHLLRPATSQIAVERVEPAKVSVTLRAPQNQAEQLQNEDVMLYARLADLPPVLNSPTKQTVAIQWELPESVELVNITPPQVTVHIRPLPTIEASEKTE